MTSDQPTPLSFLSLIPADHVFALYKDGQTWISAKGNYHEITSGIAFHRVPWVGGYKFELRGWVGPLTGHDKPYEVETPFDIQWPNSIAPSGKVVIADGNHPNGREIEVEALGLDLPKPDGTATVGVPPQQIAGTGETIFTTEGKPFSIRQTVADLKLGHSIHANFNTEYLRLDSAFLDGNDLVWTFEAIKLGKTQVVVVVASINPPFTYIVTWTVEILLLDSGKKS